MIVTSILNHNGAAVTFGLITAVAVLCSMVATAVASGTIEPRRHSEATGPPVEADVLASVVEEQIRSLVDAGADEVAVRSLVGEAVRLGRSLPT